MYKNAGSHVTARIFIQENGGTLELSSITSSVTGQLSSSGQMLLLYLTNDDGHRLLGALQISGDGLGNFLRHLSLLLHIPAFQDLHLNNGHTNLLFLFVILNEFSTEESFCIQLCQD
jgi:hypothetical protein